MRPANLAVLDRIHPSEINGRPGATCSADGGQPEEGQTRRPTALVSSISKLLDSANLSKSLKKRRIPS
jgi:hypothetical protein